MNRKKAYQVLILLLIFAFFSLVSRSLIYLFISVAIASIILYLLSSDVKRKQAASKGSPKIIEEVHQVKSRQGLVLPIVFMLVGAMMASYGITGINEVESIFVKMNLMVDEPFVLYSSIIIGFLLIFHGLFQTIKIWLS